MLKTKAATESKKALDFNFFFKRNQLKKHLFISFIRCTISEKGCGFKKISNK